jgi:hypothetical protein
MRKREIVCEDERERVCEEEIEIKISINIY